MTERHRYYAGLLARTSVLNALESIQKPLKGDSCHAQTLSIQMKKNMLSILKENQIMRFIKCVHAFFP